MKTKKRRQSKRTNLKDQHKIKRKIRDHHRKIRRAARDGTAVGNKRLRRDPGIPNLFPYKEELLQHIQRKREEHEQEREERRAAKLANRNRPGAVGGSSISVAQMTLEAARRGHEFEARESFASSTGSTSASSGGNPLAGELGEDSRAGDDLYHRGKRDVGEQSRRAFYRDLKKVIETADVIVEVLDARDPIGCRCLDLEKMIQSDHPGKKIVLLLNKIDLVPREVVQEWLTYLRADFPCIAFKASTQTRSGRIQHQNAPLERLSDSQMQRPHECLGADALMQLLKNFCRLSDIGTPAVAATPAAPNPFVGGCPSTGGSDRRTISVGLVGYPNVGKSSVINSLKREKVVNVGATPGLTRAVQEIQLDAHVKLLDCPGVVFDPGDETSSVLLRNCVRVETIQDPMLPVKSIIDRCPAARLAAHFGIARFDTPLEFVQRVAQKRGKLRRGGIVDLDAAARSVLLDWNAGRIPFFTRPPARALQGSVEELLERGGGGGGGGATLVSASVSSSADSVGGNSEVVAHRWHVAVMEGVDQQSTLDSLDASSGGGPGGVGGNSTVDGGMMIESSGFGGLKVPEEVKPAKTGDAEMEDDEEEEEEEEEELPSKKRASSNVGPGKYDFTTDFVSDEEEEDDDEDDDDDEEEDDDDEDDDDSEGSDSD